MPVAFISGAAQGIGRAIALCLAADGFDIAVNDVPSKLSELNTVVDAVRAKGRKSIAVPADVSSAEEVEAAVQTAVSDLGGLDCMVANAGILPACPFEDLTPELFNKVISVNLMGVYNCYRSAAKVMSAAGRGGRLIAASSAAGKKGVTGVSADLASKFAVRGLTQSVAREYGKYGITANCYCPGATDTPMVREFGLTTPETMKQWMSSLPIARIGQVEDVANVVSVLASEKSGCITGQSLLVDGGEGCLNTIAKNDWFQDEVVPHVRRTNKANEQPTLPGFVEQRS